MATGSFSNISSRLKLKGFQEKHNVFSRHATFKDTLFDAALNINSLREKSAHLLSAGIASGVLLLSPGTNALTSLPSAHSTLGSVSTGLNAVPARTKEQEYKSQLKELLPDTPQPLSREEEKRLEKVFNDAFGVPVKATLEGEHLNTTYGKIGAEQHLRRYPGDTISNHGDLQDQKEGMAPGLGAWGYFAPSKEKLTPDLVETEKWYAVVQTLYLPDWNTRTRYLRDWYKYRKVMVVNTDNGKAVVAAIADSGPAAFTGKQFGGSPEVMEYLGGVRYKKGPVIVFFVDDPDNKVPLGPVEFKDTQLSGVSFKAV
ncbi:hypothetical protein KBA63_01175 [Candidatus Woesebacteria bacterium]|nr:hypothetical protein [Candidatus Woesebacteria bacterium]MBP9687088.1 hypothetical protein [Candidatus Woesebacteria bacterium]